MNFISVGEGKAEHWVDMDKVETVAVATEYKAAGIEAVLGGDSGKPKSQPTKIFVVKLAMLSGAAEEKRFEDMAEAERFLEGHFAILSAFKRA
jgi:hypothetical protein